MVLGYLSNSDVVVKVIISMQQQVFGLREVESGFRYDDIICARNRTSLIQNNNLYNNLFRKEEYAFFFLVI